MKVLSISVFIVKNETTIYYHVYDLTWKEITIVSRSFLFCVCVCVFLNLTRCKKGVYDILIAKYNQQRLHFKWIVYHLFFLLYSINGVKWMNFRSMIGCITYRSLNDKIWFINKGSLYKLFFLFLFYHFSLHWTLNILWLNSITAKTKARFHRKTHLHWNQCGIDYHICSILQRIVVGGFRHPPAKAILLLQRIPRLLHCHPPVDVPEMLTARER